MSTDALDAVIEKLERTALILVGRALGSADFGESALYSTGYDRRFRPSAQATDRNGA